MYVALRSATCALWIFSAEIEDHRLHVGGRFIIQLSSLIPACNVQNINAQASVE